MLTATLAQILQCLLYAAVLGVVIASGVVASAWLARLRSRVSRKLLTDYLVVSRTMHYEKLGLQPRAPRLRQQVDEEVTALLSDPTRTAIQHNPRMLADVEGPDRVVLIADLGKLWESVDQSFAAILLALTIGTTLAAALFLPATLLPPAMLLFGGSITLYLLCGLAGLIAWKLLLILQSHGPLPEIGDARLPIPDAFSDADAERDRNLRSIMLAGQAQIGGQNEVVRALHFASGGFDTVMQLGVAHALWVIQGRAPDVIVGISAGAIQSVAVAEVLQAGELGEMEFTAKRAASQPSQEANWTSLSPADLAELQKARLLARAHRLRHFVEAAQRAPERILDVLVPDTYQIDTAAPIRPLEGPRFPAEERRQRVSQLKSMSGLTRLYNDLLGVSFSIGTMTRFARRVLGFLAAEDVPKPFVRWLIKSVEILRLGLLVGMHLTEAARLLPILLRAFKKPTFPRPRTAGVLLFQSLAIRRLFSRLSYVVNFVALVLLWALATDIASIVYLTVILALFIYLWRSPDDVILRSAAIDGLRGFLSFVVVAAFWTLAGSVMVFLLGSAFTLLLRLATVGFTGLVASEWVLDRNLTIICAALSAATLLVAALVTISKAMRNPQRYRNRLLASYDLGNSILTEHGLRAFLVDMFDYHYYPRASMDRVVDQALQRRTSAPPGAADPCLERMTVGHYSERARLRPIHLGLAVADTATGRLEVVPRATPLVDGLLASTAVLPWMPAVELDSTDNKNRKKKALFIDGANVSREPTRAMLKMIRDRLHEGTKVIHIYSVTPFPVSRPNFESPPLPSAAASPQPSNRKLWLNLVDIAWRAMRLQRFRDATLERRLTEKFSEMIPSGSVDVPSPPDKRPLRMFRAWVSPIELETDADVNRRILGATKDERRRIMYETIADGCRASLQIMIARNIQAELSDTARTAAASPTGTAPNSTPPTGAASRTLKCSRAVARHLADAPIPAELKSIGPIGSDPSIAPGLTEVCAHCRLGRGSPKAPEQTLLLGDWSELGPSWPHERVVDPDEDIKSGERFRAQPINPTPRQKALDAILAAQARGRMIWPRERSDPTGKTPSPDRPTISLLFSGGVFRGVYQMGVLNALHELGIQPDLIAGASVGSITAAMVADAFARTYACEQKARIARLASVYLTVDRLVMSDRLSDFVRNLTLRAADTRFSIREADSVFRRYDAPRWTAFDHNVRHVIAGIERLLYVNPYDLNALVRGLRGRDLADIAATSHRIAQQYLNRMQIGDEALGAEALALLIDEYVIGGRETENPGGFTIDELRNKSGVQFLATATNLTHGRLDVFGDKPACDAGSSAVLKEVLLASSAFPAVFRPRWSWEAEPGDGDPVQYIDGGVTDNLPLDAVTQFLERAAAAKLVPPSPAAPHLVIAASLEVNAPKFILEFTRRQLKQSWIVLRKRAKALGYNRKLDTYADAQDRMRSVRQQLTAGQLQALNFTPVDLKVVSIKPNWLCGTFAFHPMLGFQRTLQARSIAHGCASTLLRFREMTEDPEQAEWMEKWSMGVDDLPAAKDWSAAFRGNVPHEGHNGSCWLRKAKRCPFSSVSLQAMNTELRLQAAAGNPPAKNCGEVSDEMISALDEIYRVCPQRKTHLRII